MEVGKKQLVPSILEQKDLPTALLLPNAQDQLNLLGTFYPVLK